LKPSENPLCSRLCGAGIVCVDPNLQNMKISAENGRCADGFCTGLYISAGMTTGFCTALYLSYPL
jgi:hypothetical protein